MSPNSLDDDLENLKLRYSTTNSRNGVSTVEHAPNYLLEIYQFKSRNKLRLYSETPSEEKVNPKGR
jgi:hypothetical protein